VQEEQDAPAAIFRGNVTMQETEIVHEQRLSR